MEHYEKIVAHLENPQSLARVQAQLEKEEREMQTDRVIGAEDDPPEGLFPGGERKSYGGEEI
jgi:hypothetical protein